MPTLCTKVLEGTRTPVNWRFAVRKGGPPYLGPYHYVASLGDRLSYSFLCKICNFLKSICSDARRKRGPYPTFKLLIICSSESYLFEIPKQADRNRPATRPWGTIDHNFFMAVVPEVPLIPKTGVPLRWFETELPKIRSIYRLTQRI